MTPHKIHLTAGSGLWAVDSRRWLVPLFAALLLLVNWGAGSELSHGIPHLTTTDDEYLISLQRSDGSICMTPERDRTVPYFANLSAMVMLDNPKRTSCVKGYLLWYLRHLNRPDRYGLHGTVYDYTYQGDVEISAMDYDSADSYAATYLSLVYRYLQVSGDSEFVSDHLSDLERVAGVLIQLQDRDGLIWAKPGYPLKYLMDNAENYLGIADFSAILANVGLHDLSLFYAERAQLLRAAIEVNLWDETTGRYHWALDLLGRPHPYRPGRWYPDGMAQLYPVLYGLDEPDSARAKALYADFNQQFPGWPLLVKDDPYPWALAAYVATLMGDFARATEAVRIMEAEHIRAPGQPYWYNLEHAFYLRTLRAIRHQPSGIR